MSSEKTPVYIILGSAGSGRRELLADLIADGLAPGDQPAVFLSNAEAPHSLDAKLPPGPRWTWQPGPPAAIELEKPPLTGPLFLVADGRRNPVDQMEAFKPWLENNHAAVARVICVVDCTLASHHPALLRGTTPASIFPTSCC